jgi:hypothetical protein
LLIETPDTKKLKIFTPQNNTPAQGCQPGTIAGGSHRGDNNKPLLPCAEEAGVLPN